MPPESPAAPPRIAQGAFSRGAGHLGAGRSEAFRKLISPVACMDCGGEHLAWQTDDWLWQEVVGAYDAGHLCLACFVDRLLTKLGPQARPSILLALWRTYPLHVAA